MTNLSPSAHIELEIHRHLSSGLSPLETVQKLVENYREANLTFEELESLSHFLLATGNHEYLLQFLTQVLQRGLHIPWRYYCQAAHLSPGKLPEEVQAAIVRGAESQGKLSELARASDLDSFDSRLADLRKNRLEQHKSRIRKKREDLIANLEMLQAQGMHAEEEKMLEKFSLIFPEDEQLKNLKQKRKKRRTLDLVNEIKSHRERWIPLTAFEKPDEESEKILAIIENSMFEHLAQNPVQELAHDFAIAHIMWENYSAALRFTEAAMHQNGSNQTGLKWLQLEILFQLRRFVEVLAEISQLELKWVGEPDSTFGLMYLQACCLWEMSQKQQAIEIMESVCIVRPNFRSARILLAEWRGEVD